MSTAALIVIRSCTGDGVVTNMLRTIKADVSAAPHPEEDSTICRILNISSEEYRQAFPVFKRPRKPLFPWMRRRTEERTRQISDLVKSRTGFNSVSICKQCLKLFDLDLGDQKKASESWRWHYKAVCPRDERKCPWCGSVDVSTIMELVGKTCPLCKAGIILEEWTGVES